MAQRFTREQMASTQNAPGGTVTSIAMTVPSILSVAGSPVTGSGTFALDLATQAANKILAGPTSGGSAKPTMRSLVAADLGTGAVGAGAKFLADDMTFRQPFAPVKTTGDVNVTSTSFTNITGLVLAIAANEEGLIEGFVLSDSANTSEGINLSFTDPASCETTLFWQGNAAAATGAPRTVYSDDTGTAQTGTPQTGVKTLNRFSIYYKNSTNSGNIQMRIAGETGAIQVTAKAGSAMWKVVAL